MACGYMKYEVRRHNSYDFSQKLITQNVLGDYMKIIIQKGGLTLAREEMKIWWWWGGGVAWRNFSATSGSLSIPQVGNTPQDCNPTVSRSLSSLNFKIKTPSCIFGLLAQEKTLGLYLNVSRQTESGSSCFTWKQACPLKSKPNQINEQGDLTQVSCSVFTK